MKLTYPATNLPISTILLGLIRSRRRQGFAILFSLIWLVIPSWKVAMILALPILVDFVLTLIVTRFSNGIWELEITSTAIHAAFRRGKQVISIVCTQPQLVQKTGSTLSVVDYTGRKFELLIGCNSADILDAQSHWSRLQSAL